MNKQEKIKEQIDEIRYEIEDFFDNGERRKDVYKYDDYKILAEIVEKKLNFLLSQVLTEEDVHLETIKETIVNYICTLANVDNPDKAEKSIKDTIWGEKLPQYSAPKLVALGKVQAATTCLSIISNHKPNL